MRWYWPAPETFRVYCPLTSLIVVVAVEDAALTAVMTATVEAIEKATRAVTVKKPDGTYDVLYVPESIKRFDALKVGDKINAAYYDNVVLQVKPPAKRIRNRFRRADPFAGSPAARRPPAHHHRDDHAYRMPVPSISFSGPNGWKYTSKVADKEALTKVKVGDKVDITWTEALILSLDQGKSSMRTLVVWVSGCRARRGGRAAG